MRFDEIVRCYFGLGTPEERRKVLHRLDEEGAWELFARVDTLFFERHPEHYPPDRVVYSVSFEEFGRTLAEEARDYEGDKPWLAEGSMPVYEWEEARINDGYFEWELHFPEAMTGRWIAAYFCIEGVMVFIQKMRITSDGCVSLYADVGRLGVHDMVVPSYLLRVVETE